MNASHAFRSHLMQQFLTAARSQSRPPLALVGWIADEEKKQESRNGSASSTSGTSRRYMSSIGTAVPSASNVLPSYEANRSIHSKQQEGEQEPSTRQLQSFKVKEYDEGETLTNATEEHMSLRFQNFLQTRRTSTSFALPSERFDETYWRDALSRAVECGYNAPNHRRTEPFTFKRMISPSRKTERLAEIAYYVNIQQQIENASSPGSNEEMMNERAQNKRTKWRNIPAYLVALVEGETMVADPEEIKNANAYDQLPYVAPKTERELEDYASTCAAVQNVLLSLHAEHIASKWVTGPVIRTPAFRELVEASPRDRVVALIMVGQRNEDRTVHPRRHRRPLDGDVLVDL